MRQVNTDLARNKRSTNERVKNPPLERVLRGTLFLRIFQTFSNFSFGNEPTCPKDGKQMSFIHIIYCFYCHYGCPSKLALP